MADASSAGSLMHDYVGPAIRTLCILASLVCVFFLVTGGISYLTSAGKPDNLDHAKRVLRNALIGLVIVLAAGAMTTILTHAYAGNSTVHATALPQLQAVPPEKVSNGLVSILIKAVTGLLNNIIQSIAKPFLSALAFFTKSTELMASNSAVFNLWLTLVGITDGLFVLVVSLLGFHVMSAATFGFDEIEVKHLLPRFALIFLAINTSIFAIDGVIELSNAMISAVNAAGGSSSVWETLTTVVKHTGGQGVAALLIMVAFLIFSVILLVYYVGRLITLYIGAVLSPLLLLVWLVPGFRDFSETAAKTYLTTIFVLFVHVVILQLAASLFVGMAAGSPSHTPDVLMAMVTGLATLIALLKTQGVLMQFSYVSMGSRNTKKLGGQFINGISYVATRGKTSASNSRHMSSTQSRTTVRPTAGSRSLPTTKYMQPKSAAPAAKTITRPEASPSPIANPVETIAAKAALFDPTNPAKKGKK